MKKNKITIEVDNHLSNKITFDTWLKSDNVIELSKDGVTFWASQDAQYRNKLYTKQDAWNYYQKEFINQ